ncbi:hypothetical protein OIU76_013004 [Salix suchowensis]|nr:hypothetical protein OIU76_013004 [Salix suchowensis]
MATDDFPLIDEPPPHPPMRHTDATSVTTTSVITTTRSRQIRGHTVLKTQPAKPPPLRQQQQQEGGLGGSSEAVSERGGSDNKKSVEQCKNKIDNLKKRYKVELQRIGGSGRSGIGLSYIEAIMGMMYTSGTAAFANTLKIKPVPDLKWRRVVFKISGSALAGNCQNIDPEVAMQIAREVATASRGGLEIAIVLGGRNFFCADSWISATGLERPTAYQISMMATVMNSILLQSALEKHGVKARVQSAFAMPELAEPYSRQRAIRHLEKGRVVIFGGVGAGAGAGAGNPLFTTDTEAALRASEINADSAP